MSCNKVNIKKNKADSKVLRENMKKPPPKEMPPCENHAHHIVAGGDARASEARAKLDEFGIDINAKENRTFLPWTRTHKDAFRGNDIDKYGDILPHAEIHTEAYYQEVTNLIRLADDKETAISILEDIEIQIWNGTFPK